MDALTRARGLADAAEAALARGKRTEAARHASRALDLAEDPAPAALLLAEARGGSDAPLRAALARAAPPLSRLRLLLALGDFVAAAAEGERLLDQGLTLEARRVLWYPFRPGLLALRRAELARALAAYRPRGARAAWPLYLRGFFESDAQELPSLRRLERCDARRYGWMRLKLGWSLLYGGRVEEAARALETAAPCEPVEWRAYGFLAEARLALGDAAGARAALLRGRALAGGEAEDADAWLGAVELWSGRPREALARLDAAPSARWTPCWRAGVLVLLGRPKDALSETERALAIHGGDREARVWRAEALLALGRPREALAAVSDAAGDWPALLAARACLALGDEPGARARLSALSAPARAALPPGALGPALEAMTRRARGVRVEHAHFQRLWTR